MAGRGPAPAQNRRRANEPARGDWKPTPGIGWQHGEMPKPPAGLHVASRAAWVTWFSAWFASHWTPDDLPILRQVIKLYDKADRDAASSSELTQFRQLLDSYGITPKGQQDRHWSPPKDAAPESPAADEPPAGRLYGHLRAVGE